MGKLTDRELVSVASLNDLIHVVVTGDTSQDSSGSSYKATMKDYADIILSLVPPSSGGTSGTDIRVTGGTYTNGTATFRNNTGGTFTVTGFKTSDFFVTGGTYTNGTATFRNNTGGTFNVTGFKTSDVFVTGGTYSSGTATFKNNTGGTFTVTGFATGGGTGSTISYWSASTGTNAIVTINSNNLASGQYALAEGNNSRAIGFVSHAEGINTLASGSTSHAEGSDTQALGARSHAEGENTIASGQTSHAEGSGTFANGNASHAEGDETEANGFYSHAEGNQTIANGTGSHAEGSFTQANGSYSHAQGNHTIASGGNSHAEGLYTIASGFSSHAEGLYSRAIGDGSHAGGGRDFVGTSGGTAIGDGSFVHGENSYVIGDNSIVLGKNITGNTADTTYVDHFNIKTVPAGTSINNLGIDVNGNVVVGSGGGNKQKVITGNYVLLNSDDGYVLFIDNSGTSISITVNASVTVSGFTAGFIQEGAGDVTFIGTGVSLTNPIGLKLKGLGYQAFIERKLNTSTYYLLGNTKA